MMMLTGIRVNLNFLTDVVEAQALSYRNNYVQIYSNSWGPPDNGMLVQGPGYYSSRVLREGAYKVRLSCILTSNELCFKASK